MSPTRRELQSIARRAAAAERRHPRRHQIPDPNVDPAFRDALASATDEQLAIVTSLGAPRDEKHRAQLTERLRHAAPTLAALLERRATEREAEEAAADLAKTTADKP